MSVQGEGRPSRFRYLVVHSLTAVEDVVYIGLGAILAAIAVCLLLFALKSFLVALIGHSLTADIAGLLDEVLLILLIVELLYTVQVSFREHTLVAEPFLVVALIATVRRILVLTAQLPHIPPENVEPFRHSLTELSVLALMVLVLVGSLILLQRHSRNARSNGSGAE